MTRCRLLQIVDAHGMKAAIHRPKREQPSGPLLFEESGQQGCLPSHDMSYLSTGIVKNQRDLTRQKSAVACR